MTSKAKKEQSEASYSNNRPKQSYTHVVAYKPSPSREGAGQMFYMNKTNTKALKAGASFATSCIPYVGDAKDIQEAITGKDLITGEKLTGSDRVLTIASAGLPFVTGPMLKSAKNGGKIAVEKAPDVVKGAEKLLKKNAPKVKKAVNKTDVAKDTAKVMKKKAVEKVKINDASKNAKIIPPKQINGGTYNVEVPPAKFIGDKPVTGSHNATIKVIDKKGEVTKVWREASGNATESEKALGTGRMRQATHTEQRALTRLDLTDETVLITGQQAPCRNCQGAMRKATMNNSATIVYQWREQGKTSQAIWKNGKRVKE